MFISIQAGRGLAALAVAAFHLSITMGDTRYGGETVFRNWTSRGNLGVDFFFVLSGFIILFAHWDDIGNPQRIRSYFWKRFIRVYPIYLLYTLTFSALVAIGVGSGSHLPTSITGWIGSLSLIRFSGESPPITPAWTLFHEVAFYTLFVTLIINKRFGSVILALWFVSILFHWQYATEDNRTPMNVYLSLHNLNFFIGMGAFLLYQKASPEICRKALYGGCALLFGAIVADSVSDDSGKLALIYALSFGGLLAGMVSLESLRNRLNLRVASLVGDASYTIYLLHLALQGALLKICLKLQLDHVVGRPSLYIFVLVGSIFAGCLIYIFLERPMLRVLRAKVGAV
jgi:peptidoglycan/LPS O-acetylase OafA/YrhL